MYKLSQENTNIQRLEKELEQLKKQQALLTQRIFSLEQKNQTHNEDNLYSNANTQAEVTTYDVHEQAKISEPYDNTVFQPSTYTIPSSKNTDKKPSVESWESKIGGTLLNRIGIIAFLIGMAFFIKYAFDNQWIGPSGRIAIGLLSGMLFLWAGEIYQSKQFGKFAQGATGGGIALLYLSIFYAFDYYFLINHFSALAIMILITSTTVFLALRYDSPAIAMIALIGGFATPFLVSSDSFNIIGLLTYVLILNIGILSISFYKKWRFLYFTAYLFTQFILLVVVNDFRFVNMELIGQSFITLFFLLFALIPYLYNIRNEIPIQYRDMSLAILNAFIFYLFSYSILNSIYPYSMGYLAIFIGLIYLASAFLLAKSNDEDWLLNASFLIIALGFITVAIPLQLEGIAISLVWLLEAVVLIWLGLSREQIILRIYAYIALFMGLIKSFEEISNNFLSIYFTSLSAVELRALFPLIYQDFMIMLSCVLALILFIYFYQTKTVDQSELEIYASPILAVLAHIILLSSLSFLITQSYSLKAMIDPMQAEHFNYLGNLMVSIMLAFYSIILIAIGIWKQHAFSRIIAITIFAFTIAKVFFFDLTNLDAIYRIISFMGLGIILLSVSLAYQKYRIQILGGDTDD